MAITVTELGKKVEGLQHRTTALETKVAIAVAIAVALGLGGAGIGLLLVRANDQIAALRTQAATVKVDLDGIEPKITAATTKSVSTVSASGQAAVQQITAASDALKGEIGQNLMDRLKVSVYQFCTGEYDGPCPPIPRYDPRGLDNNKVAEGFCGKGVKFFINQYRSQSGGCCGYGWYTVTCTKFD